MSSIYNNSHYSSVFKEGDSTNPNQYTFDFSSIQDLLKKLYPHVVPVPPNSVPVPPTSVPVPSSTNETVQEFTNNELNIIRNFLKTLEYRVFRYNSKNRLSTTNASRNYDSEDEDEVEVNEYTMPTPNPENNDDCAVLIKGVSINYEGIETENYKKCI